MVEAFAVILLFMLNYLFSLIREGVGMGFIYSLSGVIFVIIIETIFFVLTKKSLRMAMHFSNI